MSATPEDVYSDLERGTSASSRSANAPAAGGDQYADLERGATLVQGSAAVSRGASTAPGLFTRTIHKAEGLAHDIWTGIGGDAAGYRAPAPDTSPEAIAQAREAQEYGGYSPEATAAGSGAAIHAGTAIGGGLAGMGAGLGRFMIQEPDKTGGWAGLSKAAKAATATQAHVSGALTYQPTNPNALPAAQSFDTAMGLVPSAIQRYVANPAKSVLPASAGPAVDYFSQFAPALIDPALRGVKAIGRAGTRSTPALEDYAARVGESAATPLPPPTAGTNAADFGADTASAARRPPINDQNPPGLNEAMAAAARGRNGEKQPNNGLNNATAIERHTRAASLPVPVTLTEAAATGDPTVFTLQKELQSQAARAGDTRLVDRVVENNNQLIGNLRALRSGAQGEGTGAEVTVPSSVADKGDALLQLAQDRGRAMDEQADAAYAELRAEANRLGPDTKVYDGTGPLQEAQRLITTSLRRKTVESTPALSGLMEDLQAAADGGGFTADSYMTTRRDAAMLARTASDGWVRNAAGSITRALDNAELAPGAENLRALDQRARGIYRQERETEEADPAYAAAKSGDPSMTGERFINRYILGTNASRAGITRFLQTLGDDTPARQIVATTFADSLRDAAKVSEDGRGVFRQASYNAQLKKLSDRIQAVSPNMGNLAQAIGDTARDVGEFPAGEVSSKSNSSDWLRSMLMDQGAKLLPGGPLVHGAVKLGKGIVDRGKMSRAVDRAVAPYAGLGRTDLAQPAIPEAEAVPDFFPRQTAAAAAQPPPPRGAPTPQMSPNRPGGPSPGGAGPNGSAPPPPPPPSGGGTPPRSGAPSGSATIPANFAPASRAATSQSTPTMTGEQAQNIVAGMPPQWRQAAIKSITDAHRMLSREQGAGTVSIADLQARTGIPLPQLHALLLSQSKLGRLSLTGQTSVEGSAAATNAAGVSVPGVAGPRVAVTMPTAPVQVGTPPPKLPPGRTMGGSPIPSAPSSVTPANIIDAMRQVQPRVEQGLSVKILDLARQMGVTPHELAKHLEPLGRQAILDLHTHPWPDRLTEAEKAQLPSNGMGGWWDAVTIRRGAKVPGGTTP